MRYEVEIAGRRRLVNVHRENGRFVVNVDGHVWSIDASRVDGQTLSLLMTDAADSPAGGQTPAGAGGRSYEIVLAADPGAGTVTIRVDGVPMTVALNGRQRARRGDDGDDKAGPQRLVAPMPGKVVRVLVKAGDSVRARQPVVVIEAMKMENELRSGRDGRVTEIAVRDGQSVEAGMLLAVIAHS